MLIDIERLSVAERIHLVEDIWDTIATETAEIPVTAAQKNELDRRLEAYAQNSEGGSSWQQVKTRIKNPA